MRIDSISLLNYNSKTQFKSNKKKENPIEQNYNLQNTLGILASLNNPKITGVVKGNLKNGDIVELNYINGALQSSKRTGSKNIIKRFDLIETPAKPMIIIEENLDTGDIKFSKIRTENGKIVSRTDNLGNNFYQEENIFHWSSADKKHLKEWYSNGKPKFEKLPSGIERGWYANGNSQYIKKNGIVLKHWHNNGALSYEKYQDGSSKMWWEDGTKRLELNADGTKKAWDKNGQLSEEITKNGTRKEWYTNGQISLEILPNGTMKEWFEDGTLQRQTFENGDVKIWNEKGELIYHKNPENSTVW